MSQAVRLSLDMNLNTDAIFELVRASREGSLGRDDEPPVPHVGTTRHEQKTDELNRLYRSDFGTGEEPIET